MKASNYYLSSSIMTIEKWVFWQIEYFSEIVLNLRTELHVLKILHKPN